MMRPLYRLECFTCDHITITYGRLEDYIGNLHMVVSCRFCGDRYSISHALAGYYQCGVIPNPIELPAEEADQVSLLLQTYGQP